ncbi:MAG TPA: 23S rRNA (pseudouridine(1915)-N(3))-methyltransferase RlmH [Patescibacteria group bacterium]|nr:23S rRNA (pseudouridine(1915)-N(3))-methyltransferase RlmH [Patescibacteria group bacterium]
MLHIHIIALGKLKESYWREAEAEYLKRLKPFAKITIHELKEESFSEKDNPEVIKEKEAKKIQNEIEKYGNSYVIALDENGKQFSSVEFAHHINNRTMSPFGGSAFGGKQSNNITLVIGGPLGLDKTILNAANEVVSLSKMTFTHQTARVILLEQVYRAIMIGQNRRYHY